MSEVVIKIENLSKQYRLGMVGTGTIVSDINRFIAKIRGKEDPTLKIGQTNILASSSVERSRDKSKRENSDYVWALKDINFSVKQGEVLGIIGKNGAGKSTLLKILSKVTTPTAGNIKIKGRVASLLEVGTGFHPELSGRENIFLNGAILGMTKAEIRGKFDEIVDFAGVENYIDTPVKRYSSGMYVRLAFAVAAHLEPEILIVDEVLAVGDMEFQKKALGKMQTISTGEGRTVLFVSHNLGSIITLCNNTMILQNGSLIDYNNTKDCIQKYLSLSRNITGKTLDKNKEIYILDVSTFGIEKLKNNNFLSDETISIKIDMEFNKWDNNAVLGFYIRDVQQRKIFTSQFFLKNTIKSIKKTFIAEIPSNFLTPNQYYLSVSVHVPNIRVIDSLEDCHDFKIVDSGTSFHFYEGSDYGCVFADVCWKVID